MDKIQLEESIKIDGVEVKEISLRKPKVRDLIAAGKKSISDAEREVTLIANLAEVSIETIQDLDLRDYMKMQKWLQNFLAQQTPQN